MAFNLAGARFLGRVPSFIESSFREKPRLDNVRVADPLARQHEWHAAAKDGLPSDPRPSKSLAKFIFRRFKVAPNADIQARYRVLKAMAISSNDHIQEIDFSAQEMRSRRFWFDRPGTTVFWLGLLYEKLSWFGRDILRPLLWWFAMVCFMGAIYFAGSQAVRQGVGGTIATSAVALEHYDENRESSTLSKLRFDGEAWPLDLRGYCVRVNAGWGNLVKTASEASEILASWTNIVVRARCARIGNTEIDGHPIWHSLQFSLKNAFALGGSLLPASNDKSAACLFGAKYGLNTVEMAATIPPYVVVGSVIESLFGTVMVFLALLGVRNHFRIK